MSFGPSYTSIPAPTASPASFCAIQNLRQHYSEPSQFLRSLQVWKLLLVADIFAETLHTHQTAAMMAPTGFPRFKDGDVEIRLRTDELPLVLHSQVLKAHLAWFQVSLSDRWTKHNAASADDAIAARYELRFDKDSAVGILSRTDEPPMNTEVFTQYSKSVSRLKFDSYVKQMVSVKAHEKLLGALYNVMPVPDDDGEDVACWLLMEIVKVAHAYNGVELANAYVSRSLMSCQKRLLEHCSEQPDTMLKLAHVTKTDWLFKEAAVYILGEPEDRYDCHMKTVSELGLAGLFVEKRAVMKAKLQKVDKALLSYDFENWFGDDEPLRHLAGLICREWIAAKLRDEGAGAELGVEYADVYHSIVSRKHRLKDEDLNGWPLNYLDLFSKGNKAPTGDENILINNMDFSFGQMADVLTEVLVDSRFGSDRGPITSGDLKFMGIGDDELPWVSEARKWGKKRKRCAKSVDSDDNSD